MASLRAFEAVARRLSFTRAARELNLTQTAISHQIKNLETFVGAQLFVRKHGAVGVTDAAHELLATVQPLMMELALASARARDRKNDRSLYVGCMATFAMQCLMPRLVEFQRQNPEIKLRFGMIVSTEGLSRRDYDVVIRYGSGDWQGFISEKLCEEEVFPVCSPALLKQKPRLRGPADLSGHYVIRTSHSFILRDDWPAWLDKAGVPNLEFSSEIDFDQWFPSIEAAIAGLGVAMGRTPLVDGALRAGRLVEPFSTRLRSEATYFVSSPQERYTLKSVRLFRNWLLSGGWRTTDS